MITRTNIEEANRHLKALHQKVVDLEIIVKDQHEAIVGKDSFIHTKIQELKSQDLSIKELNEKLQTEKLKTRKLEDQVTEQETELKQLRNNNAMLAEVLKFLPDLKSLVNLMEKTVLSQQPDIEDNAFDEAETSQGNTSVHSAADGDVLETSELQANAVLTGISETTEMARNFVKHHRQKHFSISEDDPTEVADPLSSSNSETAGKEFYL